MGGQALQKTVVFGASVSCLHDVQECEVLTEGRCITEEGGEEGRKGNGNRKVNKVEIVGETTLAVSEIGEE